MAPLLTAVDHLVGDVHDGVVAKADQDGFVRAVFRKSRGRQGRLDDRAEIAVGDMANTGPGHQTGR